MLLSVGNNRKLCKTIPIFNLPAQVTCPGSTELCRRICYAKKAERLFPASKAMRIRNLDASRTREFVEQMIAEIRTLNPKYLRIHESGDFYSQDYFNKWAEIMAAVPGTTFLAYTKTWWDFAAAPSNLILYHSSDSTTRVPVSQWGLKAHTVAKGEAVPEGYTTCTHTQPQHYCGGECCTCWTGEGSVYFDQH